MTVRPRAEVVGSLLRPEYLKEAISAHEAGELTREELTAAQDRAVAEAVELQESCGIEVVTDGEMRRLFWFDPLTSGLGGYGLHESIGAFQQGGQGATTLPAVSERLRLERNLPLEEAIFARDCAERPVKATLPSLTYASVLYAPGVSEQAYPDRDEYLADALRLTRELVRALADAGFTYVQLDAPRYAQLVDERGRERMRGLGLDPQTWLGEMIALDNELMDGFPDVTFAVHVCRGNNRSMWFGAGGYETIAEQLFSDLRAERLFLEYDTPRAGGFEPLRFVSPEKTVAPSSGSPSAPSADSRRPCRAT